MSKKISPFLWFEKDAEAAANFYVETFNGNPGKVLGAKLGGMSYYDENSAKASGMPAGSLLTVSFELEGENFGALNGGPMMKFSGAVSFVIECETQEEIDYFWDKLSEGGEAGQCGWINRDKFGLTWQVVPAKLGDYLKSPMAMQAMLKMTKLDIKTLAEA